MATTDYELAETYQRTRPHTCNSLQKLVVAVSHFIKNKDKRTLFGKDKGLAAFKRYESSFTDLLYAMVLDDLVKRNSPAPDVKKRLDYELKNFMFIFPNWQNEYAFLHQSLEDPTSQPSSLIESFFLKDSNIAAEETPQHANPSKPQYHLVADEFYDCDVELCGDNSTFPISEAAFAAALVAAKANGWKGGEHLFQKDRNNYYLRGFSNGAQIDDNEAVELGTSFYNFYKRTSNDEAGLELAKELLLFCHQGGFILKTSH